MAEPSNQFARLPPGWVTAADPSSGRPYYANPSTGETRWEPPPAAADAPAAAVPAVADPPHLLFTQPAPTATSSTPHSYETSRTLTLVSAARSVVDQLSSSQQQQQQQHDPRRHAELSGLTAGQVADLCWMQQHGPSSDGYYEPIRPYDLNAQEERPLVEPGRIETRLHALAEQLKRIS